MTKALHKRQDEVEVEDPSSRRDDTGEERPGDGQRDPGHQARDALEPRDGAAVRGRALLAGGVDRGLEGRLEVTVRVARPGELRAESIR